MALDIFYSPFALSGTLFENLMFEVTGEQPSVTQSKDGYDVTLDVPGVKRDDISVSVERNRLKVAGKRGERSFSRSWYIPAEVDAERIESSLADGVLSIRMPLRDRGAPRKVTIR